MQIPIILMLAILYCAMQVFRDFRQRSYAMAALGLACIIALALIPIPTHAVKVVLPLAAPR